MKTSRCTFTHWYNRMPIDLLKTRTLVPQGQLAAAPNPDDGGDDDKDRSEERRVGKECA